MTTKTRTPVPSVDQPASSSSALEALVGDLPTGFRTVALDHLVPHPRNPRGPVEVVDDDTALQELADSIKAQGVRQNLLVVPDPGDPDRHMIVIGHRRAVAARLAGLTEVPAVVDPTLTEAQQLELMLVENVHRSALTVVQEADGYQGLLDLGVSKADLARATGVSKATVAQRLRVAALPHVAKAKLHAGQASLEDAEALAEFENDHEWHAMLLSHLGSHDFKWKVQDAKRTLDRARKIDDLRARLEGAGVKIVDSRPDGYSGYQTFRHDPSSWHAAIDDASVIPDDAVAAQDLYAPCFNIYRPSDVVEAEREQRYKAQEDERRAAESDEERAERERLTAEREARSVAAQQLRDAVETAATLRREFVRQFTGGSRKMTAAQEKAVLGWYLAWHVAAQNYADVEAAADLLEVEPPANVDDSDTFEETWADGCTPARLALAFAVEVADSAVGSLYEAEHGWGGSNLATSWYVLLEALGYEPSTWEREQLAKTRAGDEDGEE